MVGWRVGEMGEGDSIKDAYKMGNNPDFKNEQQQQKTKDGYSKKWEVVFKTKTDYKKSWINSPRIPITEFKYYYYKAIFNYTFWAFCVWSKLS